jgi:PAS domain S-box-containing protein
MINLPIPENEKARLKALHNYEILDSLNEKEFDRITQIASLICEVPISLISFIDHDRQWLKSNLGFDLKETARSASFCQYAIMNTSLLEIEDATKDDRFKGNELVTGYQNFRFYAGFPLIDPNGYELGTLCVIDNKPKTLNPNQKKTLQLLSEEVIQLIVERRQKAELEHFEKIFYSSDDLICIAGIDGSFKKVNPAFKKMLGWDPDYLLSISYFDLIHPADIEITQLEVEKLSRGEHTANFTHRFKIQGGKYKTLQWTVVPEVATGNLFAIGRDISAEKTKELQLEVSKQKFKTFFESSQGLMNTHDLEGNFLTVNTAFAKALGYTKKEILNLSLYDTVPPEDQIRIKGYLAEIKKSGSAKGQVVTKHKDGSLRFWTYHGALERSFKGRDYIIGNAIDITDRYKLEVDLKNTQEILERTNQVARVGGWDYEVKDKNLYWTSVVKEILGVADNYQPDMMKDALLFKEGESRDRVTAALQLAFNEGKAFDIELEVNSDLHETAWIRMLGEVEMDNGVCKRMFGTFQDINDKKKAEIALGNSRKLLDTVLKSATEVSIIAVDTDYKITVFNPGAEKLLGYSASEMIGKHPTAAIHLRREVHKRSKELTKEYGYPIEGYRVFVHKPEIEGSEQREWTYVKKNGTHLTVRLIITAMRDEDHHLIGYLGIATDITDLKKAKLDMEILANQLQKQNVKLLNFAHITSHNLRAPVSNLNSLLYFYNETSDQEDKNLLFTKFETVIQHLTSTLSELIDSLKIQEDLGRRREMLSFEVTLQKTKEILAAQLIESGAIVTSDFAKVAAIEYPKTYLESILLNLFTNAIKYRSPDKIPTIHFQTKKHNHHIILTVSDNGLGIDLKKHGTRLFGLNKTFHRHPDAKGVGLFITKTQVEAMGGEITAESEVGKGSIFKITFNKNNNHEQ